MSLKDEMKKQKPEMKRRRRVPLGGRNVLTVEGKEEGYRYRVVNDVGDRVEMFKERGYEVVDSASVRIGDARVRGQKGEGSPVQAHVGNGMKGVLMRIREEFFNEDDAAKQEYIDEQERGIRQNRDAGDYGKVDIQKGR